MEKKALRKDLIRELIKSKNRFISIFMIVFLGAAFLAGIRATKPDMELTADKIYDNSSLMDIRILGTLGLSGDDVEAIEKIDGVKSVMPAYSADVFTWKDDQEKIIKLQSIPDQVNKIQVSEGRMPESSGECLMDSRFLLQNGYKIGDIFEIQPGTEDPLDDTVRNNKYKIVGSGSTPYYMSYDRGKAAIGSGSVNGFVMIPKEDFTLEVYTEIYITTEKGAGFQSYTDEYTDYVERIVKKIADIAGERCDIRYQDIRKEAEAEISDAEEEITEGEQKLANAKTRLDEGWQELTDGKQEFQSKKDEFKQGEKALTDSEKQLADGARQIEAAEAELERGRQELAAGRAEYDAGMQTLQKSRQQLDDAKTQLEESKVMLENLKQFAESGDPEILAQIVYLEGEIGKGEAASAQGEAEYQAGAVQLQETKTQLDQADAELSSGERRLAAKKQELQQGQNQARQARIQLEEGRIQLEEGRTQLQDAEMELNEGQAEYDKQAAENLPKIEDAKAEIADAKEELKKIEVPEWYILDRESLQTYVEYGQNAERIGSIGEVFPFIFFLVAALVSLTTMTRMVEEERTQIGTLKALGYSKIDIAKKYIYYALASSLAGSALGMIFGQKLIPAVIIAAYRMMYPDLVSIQTPLHLQHSFMAILASVLCTVAATMFACYKELLAQPAVLMRPAAPKSGKRVFLERIKVIWNHLNFTYKATLRNLIRYKKRFFMTVFGMGGCMALLLVGFGVNDSIMTIGDLQYGTIIVYDGSLSIKESDEQLLDKLDQDKRVQEYVRAYQISIDARYGKTTKSAYLIAVQEAEGFTDYVGFHDRNTKEEYELTDKGVVITEKLAKLLDVKAGDEILLQQDEMKNVEVKIEAVTENYFMHYIYLSEPLYQELYQEEPEYNTVFMNFNDSGTEFEDAFAKDYMEQDGVSSVSFVSSDAQSSFDSLEGLNTIIYVLVISAGLLAFVVLYNLNNINISERQRELATLKVLGFYDQEASAYVFRENVMLTAAGAVFGIFLGILLHRYVIVTAEIDMLMFGRNIFWPSYVYSIVLTFLFSLFVNLVMYFKLKKIDMVESLKSVE